MIKPKIILGIETSCDETAAAVCQKTEDRVQILSNVVASSAALQAKYGGVIPEQAAREQLKSIIPVIQEVLFRAFPDVIPSKEGIYKTWIPDQVGDDIVKKIDAIAVTEGPGLIGSLLVGVETAKTLAVVWNKPLIPVNHLIGHFYANWISKSSTISYQLSDKKQKKSDDRLASRSERLTTDDSPQFPCLGLLASGGHTDLVLFTDHGQYKYLGGTRDDAAGECFDKCARLLDLPYPGGPNLSKLAETGNPKTYKLPRPMLDSKDFDFSFSGLKTAVANFLHTYEVGFDSSEVKSNLAASIEDAITDVLVEKTVKAAQTYSIDQIVVAGGVAANKMLAKKLTHKLSEKNSRAWVFIPPPSLCTDNAAYIVTAAFFNYQPIDPLTLQANPSLSLLH